MINVIAILVAIVSYLLGSISGSILISKNINGVDIRKQGSKNAGSTNMLRVYGKKYAAFTLLIDVFKGVIAVLIGVWVDKSIINLTNETSLLLGSMKYIAAVFAVLGHDFPIYFGFKGGKGVATSIGAAITLDWKIGLIILVVSLLIMLTSKYVSLGSIIGSVIYPAVVVANMLGKNEFVWAYVISSVIMGLLIIIKHHANIVRLKNGTENKLFKKKTEIKENELTLEENK